MTTPTPVLNLTSDQLAELTRLETLGQYPAMYLYLKTQVDTALQAEVSTSARHEELDILSNWLQNAAAINANDGSFKSEFVRGAVDTYSWLQNGTHISNERFQEASDKLARDVYEFILGKQGILSAKDIIDKDVQSAVEGLGLVDPWGWAGTLGDAFPIVVGGLGKDMVAVDTSLPLLSYLAEVGQAWGAFGGGLARYSGHEVMQLAIKLDEPISDAMDVLIASGKTQAEARLQVIQALKDVLPTLASGDPYSGDPFTGLPWAGQSYETLITQLQTSFKLAEATISPLVLDLDGDGVETTLSSKTGVHFDLDKSGFAEQAGWVGKDDGLLVRDLNGDGKITHGGELFGNHTVLKSGSQAANGFEALKDLDDNNDGKVDANDSAYASLRVWKDLNSDGVTEDGELITLEQAGVQSLNVRYTNQGTGATKDAQGNQHQQLGSYTKADGSTQQMDDVWFSVDTARTVNLNTVAVSDEIAALPELRGMGNVASLRQAMAKDSSGELQTLVEQWVDVTSRSSRKPRSHKLCSLMSQSLKHQQALAC
jgi:hypothetical protein